MHKFHGKMLERMRLAGAFAGRHYDLTIPLSACSCEQKALRSPQPGRVLQVYWASGIMNIMGFPYDVVRVFIMLLQGSLEALIRTCSSSVFDPVQRRRGTARKGLGRRYPCPLKPLTLNPTWTPKNLPL